MVCCIRIKLSEEGITEMEAKKKARGRAARKLMADPIEGSARQGQTDTELRFATGERWLWHPRYDCLHSLFLYSLRLLFGCFISINKLPIDSMLTAKFSAPFHISAVWKMRFREMYDNVCGSLVKLHIKNYSLTVPVFLLCPYSLSLKRSFISLIVLAAHIPWQLLHS